MFDNTAMFAFAGALDEILEYPMEKDIDVRDVMEEEGRNHRLR